MSWVVLFGMLAIYSVPILVLLWASWGKERWRNRNLKAIGVGMAKKRGTWEIEYGVERNPQRWSGYERTETVRMIAETHDEAVALLKEYNPNFNPNYIVASKRGGLEYVIAEQ
jgi:hypothetical protein